MNLVKIRKDADISRNASARLINVNTESARWIEDNWENNNFINYLMYNSLLYNVCNV